MAASSAVRLRLRFDYPPPCGPQCRMSWILVDLNRCRVIADLCSEIRGRFGYSRRTELDLFIEECYLPPAESIYLVRDNDTIRVKISSQPCVSVSEPTEQVISGRKRRRKEEEDPLLQGVAVGPKKRSKGEEAPVNGFSQHEESKKNNKKKKRKNKKKGEKQIEAEAAAEPAEEPRSSQVQSEKSGRKATNSSMAPNKTASKASRKQKVTSDSSDSNEATPQKPPPKPKPPPKQSEPAKTKESSSSETSSSDDDPAVPSKPSKPKQITPSPIPLKPTSTNSKPLAKKPSAQPSTDSSSSSSSSLSPPPSKVPPPSAVHNEPPPALSTPVAKQSEKLSKSSDSDSSSETELVIKTPNPQGLGMSPRGGGRVRGRGGVRGGFGRARGTPWKQSFHYNYDSGEQQKLGDSQTNRSLVLENPPEPKPRRDYSTLPQLAAPPAVGQKIAFKLLELTENYTPEVSDYKEGRIVGFNHTTGMIDLELLTQTHARSEPGKFDLVYQNPDGSERVEYAVTLGSQVTERWDSLLEPRLIMESMG